MIKKFNGVLRLRCPNCGKAKVFYKTKFPFKKPVMRDECEACGYRFSRRKGFFRGAMVFSYGLSVLEMFLFFWLGKELIFGASLNILALLAICGALFCLKWNYRFSRVMWLNLFPD